MGQYISKSEVVEKIKKLRNRAHELYGCSQFDDAYDNALESINTLEVIDPYEQCVQYDSIKAGIQVHAETYSFNIESELFNQLTTKEQQELWRKEIEQACVSGGEMGVELARDPRYKENIKEKEVDFPCDENRDKELALSLQIQAYLNTASDELYGNGKPLYSKSHLEGIHECMKMWVKLHNYYFYKHTCENKDVDLEKEFYDFLDTLTGKDNGHLSEDELFRIAEYFYELGLQSKG